MDLAVVIVTHNQHDVLRNCVRSVLVAMKAIPGEVIVVDNASVDATPVVMGREFPQVRYLRNATNVHYTRAVNQGMRATQGSYVMLLNDDTVVDPDSLRFLVRFMENHPRCGAVGPALLSPQGDVQVSAQRFPTPFREMMKASGLAWWLRSNPWSADAQTEYAERLGECIVDWVCGGAILFRRSVIRDLNYHDEAYLFYRDDPDIGMRLKAAGWEVWYCPAARVVHYHGMSTVKTPKRVRFDIIAIRSRRHYHRKFHGIAGSVIVELTVGLWEFFRALKAMMLLRWGDASEHWRRLPPLFVAWATPPEESDAVVAYGKSQFNGITDTSVDVARTTRCETGERQGVSA